MVKVRVRHNFQNLCVNWNNVKSATLSDKVHTYTPLLLTVRALTFYFQGGEHTKSANNNKANIQINRKNKNESEEKQEPNRMTNIAGWERARLQSLCVHEPPSLSLAYNMCMYMYDK